MKDAQTLLRELSYVDDLPLSIEGRVTVRERLLRKLEECSPELHAAYVLRESLLNYSMIAILSVQESTMIAQLLDSLNEKLKFEPDTPKTLFKED